MPRVGVIGWPIEHSLSPAMHNAAFAALGMHDWHYDKMAIPPDVLAYSLRELQRHGYAGVNVTVPHKEAVMRHVLADTTAQMIGAINTIDFRSGMGTNTDVTGFLDDLSAHGINIRGARVVARSSMAWRKAVRRWSLSTDRPSVLSRWRVPCLSRLRLLRWPRPPRAQV